MEDTQNQSTQRQTIEQERGRQAWQCIKDIKEHHMELEAGYRSLARGLNAMIQINGLSQTLGFLYAKGLRKGEKQKRQSAEEKEEMQPTEHYYLLAHLSEWMCGHFNPRNSSALGTDFNGLLTWVLHKETTSADYRRATSECLAFGVWLSRFAEAELKGEAQ
jgi:CRISPR-associated protein Cmr5